MTFGDLGCIFLFCQILLRGYVVLLSLLVCLLLLFTQKAGCCRNTMLYTTMIQRSSLSLYDVVTAR